MSLLLSLRQKANRLLPAKVSSQRNGNEKFRSSDASQVKSQGGLESCRDTIPDETESVITQQESEDEGDDESQYIQGPAIILLAFGLTLGVFLQSMDFTILATAIPKITTVFNSLDDVGWYGSSYLLTLTSFQPLYGKIFTYFNVKWTYLAGLVIFEVGSIICATAQSSVTLIVGRAIAGVGGAALFSGGAIIIGSSVPLRKRAIYIGVLSSMFGIAAVVAPLVGGTFTDNPRLTWRWCFWLNLPIGGFSGATVLVFFKPRKREVSSLTLGQKLANMDIAGATLLIGGVVCLLLALQWGGTTYPWRDPKVYGCLVGFGIIISVFVALQWYLDDKATIPPRLFIKQRTVMVSSLFSGLLIMALYAHVFYLPFYFQVVKGTTAEESGVHSLPYFLAVTIVSLATGGVITAVGQYAPFMWSGAAILTIGSGLIHTLGVDSSTGQWIGYQILAGIGVGLALQTPFIAVQVAVSAEDTPVGMAIAIFFNSLGGALATSITQNIFIISLAREIASHTTGVDAHILSAAASASSVRQAVPPSQLAGALQAYALALQDAFVLPIAAGAAAFMVSLFVERRSARDKPVQAAGGA